MAYKDHDQIKEEILRRIDILDLVSEYVRLNKSGRRYKGLCPFHPEKTPSFHVDQEKQLFYCFGCHAGGDMFTFLMKMEGMTFSEALENLARRCGLEFTRDKGLNTEKKSNEKEQILEINLAAQRYFEERLWAGGIGLDYLRERGLGDDTIKRFGLGFAPDSWDGLLCYLRQSYPVHLLQKAGVICARQKGTGYYDRFRNRVIFPIHNIYGDICAFGGRLLAPSDESPKYLNSPETPLYSKGQVLYGFHMAKNAISQEGQAIMVEGYMDFLTLFQAGFKNAVATSGTALTVNQIRVLKRYTHDIILVFDSDSAGLKAAQRGIALFLDQGIQVKLAVLPSGRDPDSLIREEGAERFAQAIHTSQTFIDFLLFSQGLTEGEVRIHKKAEKTDEIIHFLSKISNPLEKDAYIHYVSQKVGISEDAIRERLRQLQRAGKGYRMATAPKSGGIFQTTDVHSIERVLVKIALEMGTPSKIILQNLDESDFKDPELRGLAAIIFNHWRQGVAIDPRNFMMEVNSENQKALVSQLMIGTETFEDPEQAVQDCIKKIREERINEQLKGIKKKLDSEGLSKDEEDLLLNEYCRLKKDACTYHMS